MILMLKKINRMLRNIAARLKGVGRLISMLRDPVWSRTRYPGEALKSRRRTVLDNFAWLIRHGEVNEFYWLYGLDRTGGPGADEFIAYNEFKEIRNRRNRLAGIGSYYSDYTAILKDKFVFNRILEQLGFLTPKVQAVCIFGTVRWLDSGEVMEIEDLSSVEGLDYFCKTLLGECADGVFHLTSEGGSLMRDGDPMSTADLKRVTSGFFLLQERIEQHPEMSRLYPHCINTVRLVTINRGSGPRVFAVSIRTGAGGNTKDNWAVGGLSGGVDIETGRLSRYFDMKPGYGGRTERHPDTGVVFGDFTVPMFEEARKAALELHSFMYGIDSIGWDIAITPKGPMFIEGNDNWEITPHQIIDGGLRRKFLDEEVQQP